MSEPGPESEFKDGLKELLRTGKSPDAETLSQETRQRLETASRLMKADYSSDSRIHDTLQNHLQEHLAQELPRRASRLRLSQGASTVARLAGGIALLVGLVLGLNLILGKFRPVTGGPVVTVTPGLVGLENTSWVLTWLNGAKPIQGSQITLDFSGGEASGSSGCNSYRGKYPPQLSQSMGVRYTVTVQLCPSQELMDQENAYLQAFWSATNYLVENDLLIIKDAQGKTVLAFTRSGPTQLPRTDITTAEGMVRLWYQKDRPDLNPGVQIPLKELTTDEIWNRMGLQVFQVSQGIFQYDTFLIWQTVVLPMGTGFGGVGVTSMAVADLDHDGQPELLFTYSFGSGIHQSRLGMYAPAIPGSALLGSPGPLNGIIEAETTLRDGDLLLEKISDQEVRVNAEMTSQASQPLGQALLLHQGQEVKLGLLVNPDVPVEVLNHLFVNSSPTLTATPQPTPIPSVDWAAYEAALADVIQPPGYQTYCEWDILESTPQADYVWAACADRSSLNGPAASLPAVVYFDANGNIQKAATPGDSPKYAADIKVLFPADLQDTILNYNVDPALFVHIQQRRLDATIPPLVYLAGELHRPLKNGLVPSLTSPTPAPTEPADATATMAVPQGDITQQSLDQAAITAHATASPIPTAAPASLISGQPAVARVQRDGLSLELRLPKDTYLTGEGGLAQVTIRNDGPETLFVQAGHEPAYVRVLDAQGDEPDNSWFNAILPIRSGPPYLGSLSPGESATTTLQFQVPPSGQPLDLSYTLWAETMFCRTDPMRPGGPDNLWLRLESGPIHLHVLQPAASQFLQADWQPDRTGWQLKVMDANGQPLSEQAWGEIGTQTDNTGTAGPLGSGQNGVWSGTWGEEMMPAGAQAVTGGWVAAPGYVTAVFTQTLPGAGDIAAHLTQARVGMPKQTFSTVEVAQAFLNTPLYTLKKLPQGAVLEQVQVTNATSASSDWTSIDQRVRLPAGSWLVFTQMSTGQNYESSGWGLARYDNEALLVQVAGQPGYAIQHLGWWYLDWKIGAQGFELRASAEIFSLENLVAAANSIVN